MATMPELSRFFGIVIRMFVEATGRHYAPHFHVQYQEHAAVYGIDPIAVLDGSLPLRQKRLVEAWTELHQQELLRDWALLQQGSSPAPIDPLR